MKNIFKVFTDDLHTIAKNVIALIVVIGITVIPSLYAWFNIEASWDPYSKTKDIKVAISNEDTGYRGDLMPLDVNIGDNILSSLRANDKLHWVFTRKDDALDGVKSGEYYAAIIIPKDFSKNMMSLFTDDIKHSEIKYYYNEKKNAIAPKVTDKGASAIQSEINQVFISTISDTLISSMKIADNTGKKINADTLSDSVLDRLTDISGKLSMSADTLEAFGNLSSAGNDILNLTSSFYKDAPEDDIITSLKQSDSEIHKLGDHLKTAENTLNTSFDRIDALYGDIQNTSSGALTNLSSDNADLISVLNTQAGKIDNITGDYETIKDALQTIKAAHPELPLLNSNIDSMTAKLDTSIELHNKISGELTQVATGLESSSSTVSENIKNIDTLIKDSQNNIRSVSSDYNTSVKDNLTVLSSSLMTSNETLINLLGDIKDNRKNLKDSNKNSQETLGHVTASLEGSCKVLRNAEQNIDAVCKKITDAKESGDYEELEKFLHDDNKNIGKFISAPVKLDTKKLYPVENYGSAMAPFYSTLAIWVGGIVLVAIMKVDTDEKYPSFKHHEKYFGRYILFLILGLLQTTLIILGDLYFLEIQCHHPLLLLLAGWLSSLVYVNIIYTLTISFGDVGKAISVILLVMQVAGTGGTFPIECAPPLFRKIYPLLPFTHSMNAMRECIGGFYDNSYCTSLLKLLLFLIPSLLLGLLLRKPVIKLNKMFTEKLEDTKIM